jgi:hypothetical protein
MPVPDAHRSLDLLRAVEFRKVPKKRTVPRWTGTSQPYRIRAFRTRELAIGVGYSENRISRGTARVLKIDIDLII